MFPDAPAVPKVTVPVPVVNELAMYWIPLPVAPPSGDHVTVANAVFDGNCTVPSPPAVTSIAPV
jgi:hypothetical protein